MISELFELSLPELHGLTGLALLSVVLIGVFLLDLIFVSRIGSFPLVFIFGQVGAFLLVLIFGQIEVILVVWSL